MQLKHSDSNIFKIGIKLCLACCLLFLVPKTQAAEEFNAGETIIEHVEDAYEWHILTYKDKHVSISLPVIVIDNGKFHCFSSSH